MTADSEDASPPREQAPTYEPAIFDIRRRARDEKREAVLRLAVRMFLNEGYHRTPLAKIAEQLKITKPALYHYFSSKEEILQEVFQAGHDAYENRFVTIENGPGNGLSKLKAMIEAYVRIIVTDFGMCAARLDDRNLGEETRVKIRLSKRRFDAAFRSQIQQGMEDGSIRPCNPKIAAFVITGALNGVPDWFRPNGALKIETIAQEFSLRLTEGLCA